MHHSRPHGFNMNSHKSGHKRVLRACQRCRQKKIKCDREFPCKRCKDDESICTVGRRKKTEYKQLPPGYGEVLENTQLALIATVQKLYAMVRNGAQWDLAEPELNDGGQPVIHDIVTLLGLIRPAEDINLPPHTTFLEDGAGLSRLAAEIELQHQLNHESLPTTIKAETEPIRNRRECVSSSDLDLSDSEQHSGKAIMANQNFQPPSPQSFHSCSDFVPSALSNKIDPIALLSDQPSNQAFYPIQYMGTLTSMSESSQFMQQMDVDMAGMMLRQGLVKWGFDTPQTHIMSYSNSDIMLGFHDPAFYSGYGWDI